MDRLPGELIIYIFEQLPYAMREVGREVCRGWAVLLPYIPQKRAGGIFSSIGLVQWYGRGVGSTIARIVRDVAVYGTPEFAHYIGNTTTSRSAIITYAAGAGRLDILLHLGIPAHACPRGIYKAAKHGHREVLQTMLQVNRSNAREAVYGAIVGGQVELLRWLITGDENSGNGMYLDAQMQATAAMLGHVAILDLCASCEHLAIFSVSIATKAIKHSRIPVLDWLYTIVGLPLVVTIPADISPCVVSWTVEKRVESWLVQIPMADIGRMDLPALQAHYAAGCTVNSSCCNKAAAMGSLPILQWLRSVGCPWDGTLLVLAARTGNVHILAWAVDNGCPVNAIIRRDCAYYGYTV